MFIDTSFHTIYLSSRRRRTFTIESTIIVVGLFFKGVFKRTIDVACRYLIHSNQVLMLNRVFFDSGIVIGRLSRRYKESEFNVAPPVVR